MRGNLFSADSATDSSLCFSRRFQSLTGQETICFGNASRAATSTDLEIWKQDLLAEVRREIQTVKLEIIEGEYCFLCQAWIVWRSDMTTYVRRN